MKKIIFYSLFAALMLAASCQKTPVANPKGNGTLYLGSLALSLDETVETKASEAAGN